MNQTDKKNPHSIARTNEHFFRQYFEKSADVVLHSYQIGGEAAAHHLSILLIYCNGMVDMQQLNQFVLPRLERLSQATDLKTAEDIARLTALPLESIQDGPKWLEQMERNLFIGYLLLYLPNQQALCYLDISHVPARQPEESAMESSIKGPRDGFTEEIAVNMGLIRKRLRTQSLCMEMSVKGSRGRNKLVLFYISDIINPDILNEIRTRIGQLDTDALLGTSIIEGIVLGQRMKSMFPLYDTTSRPDYVASALLNGRFALMCEGSPIATIAPANLYNLVKSAEDESAPFHIVVMQRLLRYIGLLMALFLPGFYVGLTSFNLEQVPLPLLGTIANTRQGLPMPVFLEAGIMLLMFDIFAEAGRRLPRAVGQTVTVVGGLIIGDASIRAGITSPTVIVMIAISIIATYTLVDPVLSGTVAQVRIYILVISSILGLYGFMIGFLFLVLHLAALQNYGVPYLTPLSPFYKKDFIQGVLMKSSYTRVRRPGFLRTKDETSGKEPPK